MLRGLYTSTAGMISQQRKHDTITNNISNVNTPGFKQGNAVSRSFPEMLIALSGNEGGQKTTSPSIGRLNTGVLAEEDLSIYLQGDLQETKSPFDLAIVSNIQRDTAGNALPPFDGAGKYVTPNGERVFQPQAFFTVVNEAGERRYSRNGKLTINEAGQVVTPEGYQVLGQNGQPIILNDPNVKIAADGSFLDPVNGQPLAADGTLLADPATQQPMRLLISRVENPNRMIREGNGVYRINAEDEGNVTTAVMNEEVQIHQGFIERSNVDSAQSVVDMMSAARAYEANQKMVQFLDRSLDKAVNEVGKV